MEFPTLFGDASTGKKKVWSIKVKDNKGSATIITEHGYVDGKKQINEKEISEGKNIGKKNETTPLQQAISDARATWQKKKDAGYAESESAPPAHAGAGKPLEDIAESRAKATSAEVPLPMLALDFNKRGSSMTFPCYVQRKYDGTRCVAVPQQGLFSRNRKRYPNMEHILNELKDFPSTLIFDGELYSDELTFQEIVGLVKRETLKAGDAEKVKLIKYHVYDMIYDAPYEDRYARLKAIFDKYKFTNLVMAPTEVCANEEQMKVMHGRFVEMGYEGIMLRNKKGKYKVGQRSADLLKYKTFEDAEYKITNFTQGTGVEEGCVIWECITKDGKKFMCRPQGTREERMELFKNGKAYIGKELTVKYQELTDDGLPRFPVGLCIRSEYE
jgi:DNA ligase-1